jgi:hypothetical protein
MDMDMRVRAGVEEDELVNGRCNVFAKGDANSWCILGISYQYHTAKMYYFRCQPVNLPKGQVSMETVSWPGALGDRGEGVPAI